ncbi:MAG: hypothetical protein JO218_03400 [Burkholderiales bacterium]|nr:hypothetical protein [Burkholderiales bacterium]
MNQQRNAWLAARLASLSPQWVAGFPLILDERGVVTRFFKCELRSQFRHIVVGGEPITRALLDARAPSGDRFPPDKVFRLATGADGLLKLDRLCRLVHTLNHCIVAERRDPLLLQIHPRLFDYVKVGHGRVFAKMLAHFDLSPTQIILEVSGNAPVAAIDCYRSEGFSMQHVQESVAA